MIRVARPGDLPDIVRIYNESIPGRLATADNVPVSVASREKWFADHPPDKHPLLVCEDAGQVVGWTCASPFYGRPAYRATAEVSTYVATDHQGRGIGSALRTRLIEMCPEVGIRTLLSFVFAENTASVALNERFGFEIWGRLPRVAELDSETRDLLIMGRHLAPR